MLRTYQWRLSLAATSPVALIFTSVICQNYVKIQRVPCRDDSSEIQAFYARFVLVIIGQLFAPVVY